MARRRQQEGPYSDCTVLYPDCGGDYMKLDGHTLSLTHTHIHTHTFSPHVSMWRIFSKNSLWLSDQRGKESLKKLDIVFLCCMFSATRSEIVDPRIQANAVLAGSLSNNN